MTTKTIDRRALAKTLTWRFIATVTTILVAFLFTGSLFIRERRRVIQAVEGRDEVSLDMLSSEAKVPYERTRDYLTNLTAA